MALICVAGKFICDQEKEFMIVQIWSQSSQEFEYIHDLWIQISKPKALESLNMFELVTQARWKRTNLVSNI